MKILIAGNGKVGGTLANELSAEGHDVVLIDSDPAVLARSMERIDVMAVQGNCATVATLKQAGAESADLLIATTGTDELNLLCCMTAHYVNPSIHTIARIRDPEYTDQALAMRDAFALSMTFNPEREAATEMERLIKYPGFLKRDSFVRGRVEIVELRVDAESKLRDVPLAVLPTIVKCRVLVCAVLRNGEAITPDGNFVLREGDRLFVTAPSDTLAVLLKNLGIVTRKTRKVLIAGGGMISYYLSEALLENHIDVTIVEKNPDVCVRLATQLPEANIIHGDASNQAVLEREGLATSDAVVSLTGSDEINMIISLFGNNCDVPLIMTKIGRLEDGKMIDSLPLGSVISPRKLCCNNIVRYVRAMQNQTGAAITIHSIADGQAEAMEFAVDTETLHCNEPLRELKLKKNILIVCITRGDAIEIPNGSSSFREGDRLVVVVSGDDVILQINDIFA